MSSRGIRVVAVAAGVLLLASACTKDTDPSARPTAGDRKLGEPVAAAATGTPVEQLYVVHGADGRTERSADVNRLTIDVPDDDVLVFDDRPHRGASHVTVADLVEAWPSTFAGDPPNAAVSATGPDGEPVDVAVELTDPSWEPATGQLTVTARTIGDDRGSQLPERLSGVSLFIDSAQNTISLNLTNLTQVLLQIQSASPDISTWESSQSPTIGWDFGEGSSNGPSLSISYTNPDPGVPFVAEFLLVGDYQNQWQLQLEWDAQGNPSASVTQFDGEGVGLVNEQVEAGVAVRLEDLNPDYGQTANYQVVFTHAQA